MMVWVISLKRYYQELQYLHLCELNRSMQIILNNFLDNLFSISPANLNCKTDNKRHDSN